MQQIARYIKKERPVAEMFKKSFREDEINHYLVAWWKIYGLSNISVGDTISKRC